LIGKSLRQTRERLPEFPLLPVAQDGRSRYVAALEDGTVPDEPILRGQAREAMRRGTLPSRRSDRMYGGPGSGQPCVVCGKPLPPEEMEIELEFNRDGATRGVDQHHLHQRCYAAWESSVPR
jgi:hypothetical protein